MVCFIANTSSLRFFERVAVSLERKAIALECFTQRFNLAGQRSVERSFEALGDATQQGFGARDVQGHGDLGLTQQRMPTAVMRTHQAAYAALSPCVRQL